MGGMLQDLAFAIPGVDEAMGFAEIMKCVGAGRTQAGCGLADCLQVQPSNQLFLPDASQARKVDAVLGHCV